jgi:hypothetical protein
MPAATNQGAQPALPQPPGAYYMAEPARRYKVVGDAEYWLEDAEASRCE